MAEYTPRSGYNVGITGGAGGSETGPLPDTIEAQWIRKLERDLWVRFWGPGVACSDWDSNTEYDRATGWNQSASYDAGTAPGTGTARAGMGDLSGIPDSHLSAGSGISTSDPRDATGYGKYTVRANITNASQNTTCVITCPGHGLLHDSASGTPHEDGTLSVPNKIQIVGVPANSMHELNCDNVNNQFFYAKVIDNDTLALYTDVTHASGVTTFNTSYDSFGNTPWLFGSTEGYVNFVVDFEELSGDLSTGNYETTTTIARDQYIAIQGRINAAIKRTGQSTFATGTSKALIPLVQHQHGAMHTSAGDPTSDINEDMGRVRDDHVNKMSDEIELIGAPLNTNIASLGTYNFHKMHVHGIYAPYSMNNHDDSVYDDEVDQTGTWQWDDAWGSDTWSNSGVFNTWPWNAAGGSNYKRDRPFIEACMTFLDWNHLRYWFNQGGCCLFWPDFAGDGSMGGWLWQNLARANNPSGTSMVFTGQYAPYHENASLISSNYITFRQGGYGFGWGVTGDCPRVHGFGDKEHANGTKNAYFAGTGGGTTDGTTITGLTTTYMAANDILHLGDWLGEIKSIDSGSVVTLYRNIRLIGGTEYVPGNQPGGHGDLSGLAWACSKWYRACQYDGGGSLYGDNSPFPNDESTPGDGGFIHYDWRFVKDPGQLDGSGNPKPCIFYRMMYDNTGNNCTVHGTGKVRLGSRRPKAVGYFYPEQGATPPVVTNDRASTAEDDYHSSTNPGGRDVGLNRINDETTSTQ